MPSGDAIRSWFPEMLEGLAEKWSPSLSWEEWAVLCREMTELRTRIRKERRISGQKMFCKGCGEVKEMVPLPIGIRSMLFALKKVKLLDDDQLVRLDKEWKKHQRIHGLDNLGTPKCESKTEGRKDSHCVCGAGDASGATSHESRRSGNERNPVRKGSGKQSPLAAPSANPATRLNEDDFDPYSGMAEPEYYWCVHCERTYRRGQHRTVGDRFMCRYEDCDGSVFADGVGWEAILHAHPEYPAKPKPNTHYPQ